MIITITIDAGDESSWVWDSGPCDPDEAFEWAQAALDSARTLYTGAPANTHEALVVLAARIADVNASIRDLASVERKPTRPDIAEQP